MRPGRRACRRMRCDASTRGADDREPSSRRANGGNSISRRTSRRRLRDMGPAGWLVGIAVAVATLVMVGLDLGLLASGGGLLVVTALAILAGTSTACLVDSRYALNAAAVATGVAALLVIDLAV